MNIERLTSSAASVLHKIPVLQEKISEPVKVEIGGQYLNRLILEGAVGPNVDFIDGAPLYTDMKTEEFKEFMASTIAQELEQESLELAESKLKETFEGIESIPIKDIAIDDTIEEDADNAVVIQCDLKGKLHLLTGRARIKKLQQEGKDSVEAEIRTEITEEMKREFQERQKTIQDKAQTMQQLVQKPIEIGGMYYFKESGWIIIQIGHVDRDLRDYGLTDKTTLIIHVWGYLQKIPGEIDIGTDKVKFGTFEPLDLREREQGGELTVTMLTHDTLMTFAAIIEQAVRVGSVLKLTQEVRRLKAQVKVYADQAEIDGKVIGQQKARIEDLRRDAGDAGQFSASSAVLTILTSCMGLPLFLAILGLIFVALLPFQTTCTRPVYNATTNLQIACLSELVTPNPLIPYLPVLLTLAGVFVGGLLSMRHFRGRK